MSVGRTRGETGPRRVSSVSRRIGGKDIDRCRRGYTQKFVIFGVTRVPFLGTKCTWTLIVTSNTIQCVLTETEIIFYFLYKNIKPPTSFVLQEIEKRKRNN